jgi:hypothetical protein
MTGRDRLTAAGVLAGLLVVAFAAEAESAAATAGRWPQALARALAQSGSWALAAVGAMGLLALALVVAILWRMRRRRDDDEPEPVTPPVGTRGERVLIVLIGTVVLVALGGLFVALVNVDVPPLGPAGTAGPSATGTSPAPVTSPAAPSGEGGGAGPSSGLLLAVGALAAVVIGTGVRLALRARERLGEADGGGPSGSVHQAVAAAGVALAEVDEPRAAVLACYAALERGVVRAGIRRRPSDTPADLLARAGLTSPAARDLAELFREARFSAHPIGPDHVRRAEAALAEVRADAEALSWS